MPNRFGDALRVERERLRLSQEQLGDMLEVSQQAVANWEAGTAIPRPERRKRLIQILGPGSELAKLMPRYEFAEGPLEPGPSDGESWEDGRSDMTNNEPKEPLKGGLEDTRRKAGTLHARRGSDRVEFLEALPEALRQYVDGSITIGAATRRLDYLSPYLGVDVKRLPIDRTMAWAASAPSLLNLAMVRSVTDSSVKPPRQYALILVSDGLKHRSDASVQRLMFDAGVLGVTVHQVESMPQAAQLVAELESNDEERAQAARNDGSTDG